MNETQELERFIRVMADDEPHLKIATRWVVCPCCNGRGSTAFGHHADEALVFTSDDMNEDPDFAEAYMNREYDRACPECNGRTTVQAIDEKLSSHEAVKAWDEWLGDAYESAAMYAAERAMGA